MSRLPREGKDKIVITEQGEIEEQTFGRRVERAPE